jgi:hypothetical protein
MSHRLPHPWVVAWHFVAATTLVVQTAPAQQPGDAGRDWAQFPAIEVARASGDIYALGDIHGDYQRMIRLLAAAGIVNAVPARPEDVQWAAAMSVLVCTGDMIDKGEHSLEVISALRALRRRAALAGGRVILTMGNHEAEFLADPMNEKSAIFRGELQAQGLDPIAVARGSDRLGVGQFLRSLPFAARVDDWFFAHAGNTNGMTLEQLRKALEDGVRTGGYGAPILKLDDSLLEARLHKHPWWEQPQDDDGAGEARLRRYVHALGASHLVIGHQPESVEFADGDHRKKGEMYQKFDGLVFLIDVGMSHAVDDSKGFLLRIHGRDPLRATVIDHEGGHARLWTEN